KEVAASGVRVNAICPGILRTQMWEYLSERFKQGEESKEAAWGRFVHTMIPLGRPQTPDDIGALAVYLATAQNVTGQALNVDDGMELQWADDATHRLGWSMSVNGSCLCGGVRYVLRAASLMYHCHCGTCRKANGTAFATNLLAPAEAFEITS